MVKHRHKWKWIVGGYARECVKCGKREYFGKKAGREHFGEGISRGSRFR